MTLVSTEFDADSGVGCLTLNRPEVLNALDVPTAQAFLAAVRDLTARAGLRVIVLRGAGRAFAAGGDVAGFAANGIEQAAHVIHALLDAMNPAIVALRQHPAPVITAIHGVAAGAGLSLALSGDLIVASEQARFVLAYDRVGAPPDCGLSWFLAHRVGRGLAADMMLTGRTLTAAQGLDARLVDRVLPHAEFEAGLQALTNQIAAGPTLAFGHFKALTDGGLSLPAHLEEERRRFVATTRTDDFAEGVDAFIAKRAPVFRGS